MDFMQAVSYPFEDDDWLKKIAIAVVIQLIPFFGTALILPGWAFYIAQNVKNGVANPLPEWDNFGGTLGKGFTLFLAGLIYQIPTILVLCILGIFQLLPALGLSDDDLFATLSGIVAVIFACCMCIVFIYSIVAWFVYMAGYVRFLDTEEFSTFMQIGDNIALFRENIGTFVMLAVWSIVAAIGAGFVTSFVAGLGRQAILSWVTGHLIGQAAISLSGTGAGEAAAPAV